MAVSATTGVPGHLVKIVVTGSYAAGRTTFIRSVSDTPAQGTEKAVTDGTGSRKDSTTVAMDHGRIRIGADVARRTRQQVA